MTRQRHALFDLKRRLEEGPILASDGSHGVRLRRIVESIQDHANREPSDDRLLHLMSRVGVLSKGLANDLKSGQITIEQAATVLDQLSQLGDLSFDEWRSE